MSPVRIGDAKVFKVNSLTYVVRDDREGFWLDEATALVGVDDDDGNTHWGTPGPDGFEVVKVEETSPMQYQLIEALVLFERE